MATVLAAGTRPRRSVHVSMQTVLAVGIMLVLLAIAAAAGVPMLHEAPMLSTPTLPWWGVALGFLSTEAFVQHLQGRREAQTFSLSEIPLVLALFLATPDQLFIGQAIGLLFVQTMVRRLPPVKA